MQLFPKSSTISMRKDRSISACVNFLALSNTGHTSVTFGLTLHSYRVCQRKPATSALALHFGKRIHSCNHTCSEFPGVLFSRAVPFWQAPGVVSPSMGGPTSEGPTSEAVALTNSGIPIAVGLFLQSTEMTEPDWSCHKGVPTRSSEPEGLDSSSSLKDPVPPRGQHGL
jgi:hypothetical protein